MRALERIIRLALALLLLLLVACAKSTPTPAPVVVLADVSGSAHSPEVQQGYRAAFTEALTYAAKTQGKLTVETVEANPLQHSGTPVAIDFALPASVRSNPVYAQPLLARRRETALRAMDQLLGRPPGAPGSDITSAVTLAARAFGSSGAKGGWLIVCSDMIQSTGAVDFYDGPLGDADIERLITELRQRTELPDLGGVSVWVVGAGQDAGSEIEPERNRAIEHFWRAYFSASGARLVSYAATLATFPPPERPS